MKQYVFVPILKIACLNVFNEKIEISKFLLTVLDVAH